MTTEVLIMLMVGGVFVVDIAIEETSKELPSHLILFWIIISLLIQPLASFECQVSWWTQTPQIKWGLSQSDLQMIRYSQSPRQLSVAWSWTTPWLCHGWVAGRDCFMEEYIPICNNCPSSELSFTFNGTNRIFHNTFICVNIKIIQSSNVLFYSCGRWVIQYHTKRVDVNYMFQAVPTPETTPVSSSKWLGWWSGFASGHPVDWSPSSLFLWEDSWEVRSALCTTTVRMWFLISAGIVHAYAVGYVDSAHRSWSSFGSSWLDLPEHMAYLNVPMITLTLHLPAFSVLWGGKDGRFVAYLYRWAWELLSRYSPWCPWLGHEVVHRPGKSGLGV